MKKIIISLGVVLAFAFYAVLANRSNTSPITANPATIPTTTPTSPITLTTPNVTPTTTAKPQPKPVVGAFKDGSYTGPVTDAYYGNVQVKATIQGGKLTNVQFLQYPNEAETSQQINASAMPKLTREAIIAQSARIDIVSGATQTSGAFQKSLAAAIALAK